MKGENGKKELIPARIELYIDPRSIEIVEELPAYERTFPGTG
jgi:hypothetical protein